MKNRDRTWICKRWGHKFSNELDYNCVCSRVGCSKTYGLTIAEKTLIENWLPDFIDFVTTARKINESVQYSEYNEGV